MKGIKKAFISMGLALTLLVPFTANAQEKSLKEKCDEIAYAFNKELIETGRVSIKGHGQDLAFDIDFSNPEFNEKRKAIISFYDGLYNRPLVSLLDSDFDGTLDWASYASSAEWYKPEELLDEEISHINQLYKDAIDYFWKSKNIEGKVKLHKHIIKLKNKIAKDKPSFIY